MFNFFVPVLTLCLLLLSQVSNLSSAKEASAELQQLDGQLVARQKVAAGALFCISIESRLLQSVPRVLTATHLLCISTTGREAPSAPAAR